MNLCDDTWTARLTPAWISPLQWSGVSCPLCPPLLTRLVVGLPCKTGSRLLPQPQPHNGPL